MSGITRINIDSCLTGPGSHRFTDSREYHPAANILYRQIFKNLKMELEAGDDILSCTKDQFEAGYDKYLGIDVELKFLSGQKATLQEKFLFTPFNSLTVEYFQNWRTREHGDWFNMKAQYYFVGYDLNKQSKSLKPWILVDWMNIVRATNNKDITWFHQPNGKENARASFVWAYFYQIPQYAVLAKS